MRGLVHQNKEVIDEDVNEPCKGDTPAYGTRH